LAVTQTILLRQLVRAAGLRTGALDHFHDRARLPGRRQQPLAGLGGGRRGLDQLDHRVDVGQCHRLPFEDVTTLAGFAQFVDGPAGHYLAAVTDEGVKQLLQIENARLPVEQAHHVDAEHVLHLGLGVQVVEDDLGHLATTQLDDHTHAVLVGLVAQLADALELLFLDQLGNTLDQLGLVNLVGQLVDDDLLAAADLVDILDFAAGPDIDTTPAGLVGLDDSRTAIDDAGGGEVRARYVFHQLVDGDIRIGDDRQTAIDYLGQVVRRNIGRHAHCETIEAVDLQVQNTCGQHIRDLQRAVVVVDPIDGYLVQVREQLVGHPGHADFGIPHCL